MANSTIYQPLTNNSPIRSGEVVVGEPPVTNKKELVDMKASIFFDGTTNSRNNIKALTTGTWKLPLIKIPLVNDSYYKSFSNIAIMEYMNIIKDEEKEVSVYVEGSGTLHGSSDDFVTGGGLGIGPMGIEAKVTRGILDLKAAIEEVLKHTGKHLNHLEVNVFGFSRGAATARYFVARRTGKFSSEKAFPGISLCEALNLRSEAIEINFVGLFDTVSSYGEGIANSSESTGIQSPLALVSSFQDDVKQLHLAIGGKANQVVQLAAGDEYRLTFARTNIDSSIKAGVGFECVIPGAHADIGGGSLAKTTEVSNIFSKYRKKLIEQGWYEDNDKQLPLPIRIPQSPHVPSRVQEIIQGKREGLTNRYQYIPLKLMMAFAKEHGAKFKDFSGYYKLFRVPDGKTRDGNIPETANDKLHNRDLTALYDIMHKQVFGKLTNKFELPKEFYWVRGAYLHRSEEISGPSSPAMRPNINSSGVPERQVISDSM